MNRETVTPSRRADVMGLIDRPVFAGFHQRSKEDIAGKLEIQPHAPGTVAHQDHVAIGACGSG